MHMFWQRLQAHESEQRASKQQNIWSVSLAESFFILINWFIARCRCRNRLTSLVVVVVCLTLPSPHRKKKTSKRSHTLEFGCLSADIVFAQFTFLFYDSTRLSLCESDLLLTNIGQIHQQRHFIERENISFMMMNVHLTLTQRRLAACHSGREKANGESERFYVQQIYFLFWQTWTWREREWRFPTSWAQDTHDDSMQLHFLIFMIASRFLAVNSTPSSHDEHQKWIWEKSWEI